MTVRRLSIRIRFRTRVRWLVAVLCCGWLAFGVRAAEPVVIVFDADNPPFMFGLNDHPAGIYPALVSAAMERASIPSGWRSDHGSVPWLRAKPARAGLAASIKTKNGPESTISVTRS